MKWVLIKIYVHSGGMSEYTYVFVYVCVSMCVCMWCVYGCYMCPYVCACEAVFVSVCVQQSDLIFSSKSGLH